MSTPTMQRRMTHADKKAWAEYQDMVKRIQRSTSDLPTETERERTVRKERLKTDFVAFCKYYFGRYMDADFAWFHRRAIKEIEASGDLMMLCEWHREAAKSVFLDVFVPMYLYARGELTGVMLASDTAPKAAMLLRSLQGELDGNQRWLADYGQLAQLGTWADGEFATVDGIRFLSLGRGQSPRGSRDGEKRPNYGVIDDIDDDKTVLNPERTLEILRWVMGPFYGAMPIKASRLVWAGNRIHRNSALARFAGDVNEGDPIREGLIHIKVFATEDPKTHRRLDIAAGGVPAWKERYTVEMLDRKMKRMGTLMANREYYHEHFVEGSVFRPEWIQWRRMLAYESYDAIVAYCDPSWKDTRTSDYKAIIMVGFAKSRIDVLKCWVRQATTLAMVKTLYDWWEEVPIAQYWVESGLMQDMLVRPEFESEGERRGAYMPIRYDSGSKPAKVARIENMSPHFERGIVGLNDYMQKDPDFRRLVDQLMSFPTGHDDAPDGLEGAITKGQRLTARQAFTPRMGSYSRKSSRD